MIQAAYHFPRGFLWGTATAAHQVEGNNTNNQWWAWEQAGHTRGTSGLATDWWGGRWKEDLDRAAEGGQNTHRFSVEWSRIQPTPDSWDEDALERYRNILRGMRERGITPMVTLHHFTDPIWLGDGWETGTAIQQFERFAGKAVQALKEYCTLWCTFNEPNGYILNGYVGGGLTGHFPPGKDNLKLALQVYANMIRAHAAVYRTIHQVQPEARVGIALQYRAVAPHVSWSPLDRLLAGNANQLVNHVFPLVFSSGRARTLLGTINVPEAKGTQDFFGFNYYTRSRITFDLRSPQSMFSRPLYAEGADLSDMGFLANEPDGMFQGLKWVIRTFPNLPILITENGVADANDQLRPRYLAQHVHQMWRAVNFNWPIKGYFHWTLVDNFEWDQGWNLRFGLWALDEKTQKRTKRPSADFYAEICRENGLTSEMIQKYCPEVFDKLFPV